MSSRSSVKSAFENLRPTILREPVRSAVSPEAAARLLEMSPAKTEPIEIAASAPAPAGAQLPPTTLLQKKKKERLLLVSFRMPQGLKERLEQTAKRHEINQTDIINEAIELNLQRYV